MDLLVASQNPTEIELRICIQSKYMRISDYPNYKNVCEISDKSMIKDNISHKFAMSYLLNESIIAVKNLTWVTSFDDRM